LAYLLDVNVLVALFDPTHLHHEGAHRWFGAERDAGWASCPITENGLLRVLSNPAYPGRRTTVSDATARLRRFMASGGHEFWPDDMSVVDDQRVSAEHLTGHAQITDAYLLALAVRRGGRLATFDRGVRLAPVTGAGPEHLVVIEAK
jgi:toxin-antitoxin system PIN domain toxin